MENTDIDVVVDTDSNTDKTIIDELGTEGLEYSGNDAIIYWSDAKKTYLGLINTIKDVKAGIRTLGLGLGVLDAATNEIIIPDDNDALKHYFTDIFVGCVKTVNDIEDTINTVADKHSQMTGGRRRYKKKAVKFNGKDDALYLSIIGHYAELVERLPRVSAKIVIDLLSEAIAIGIIKEGHPMYMDMITDIDTLKQSQPTSGVITEELKKGESK